MKAIVRCRWTALGQPWSCVVDVRRTGDDYIDTIAAICAASRELLRNPPLRWVGDNGMMPPAYTVEWLLEPVPIAQRPIVVAMKRIGGVK